MLRVPKSLLASFRDYAPFGIDVDLVLEYVLDRSDRLRPSLDLAEIRRRGLDDPWTSRHLERVAVELARECLSHHRNFDGISIESSEKTAEAPLQSAVKLLFDRVKISFRTQSESLSRTPKVPGTSWMIHPAFPANELVLIDAPICLGHQGQSEPPLFLSDYPEYLRRPRDPVVRLKHSSPLREKLMDQMGTASEWHPFFRILGAFQTSHSDEAIEVLGIFVSRPESPAPGWKEAFFREAKEYQYQPESQQEVYLSGLLMDLTLAEATPTEEEKKSQLDSIPREYTDPDNLKRDSVASVMRAEDNIHEGVYGFWPVLLAILHDWPHRFPLLSQDLDWLLAYFDHTYTDKWKANQQRLEPLEFFRFTDHAATSMRQRLESLKVQFSDSPKKAPAAPKLQL